MSQIPLSDFESYVKQYQSLGYISIPRGLSVTSFVSCLYEAYRGDFAALTTDHNAICKHFFDTSLARGFRYTEKYCNGKAAEKLGSFGAKDNFNTIQDLGWYKQYLTEPNLLGAESAHQPSVEL